MVKKGLARALERKMGQSEGLLSKIDTKAVDSSLLMNDTRRRIFQFICNHPGVHLRCISRVLDFSTQTAAWHLRKLLLKDLVSISRFDNKDHYYPLKDCINLEEKKLLAIFYNDDIKKIYLHLKENPNISQKQMIDDLNIYQQLVSKALITLKNYDIVTYETQNRKKIYKTTDRLVELEDHFDSHAKDFENRMVLALSEDGVDPVIISSGSDAVIIEVDSGGLDRTTFELQKNPVRALLKPDK